VRSGATIMMPMMMKVMCVLAESARTLLVSGVTSDIDRDQLELYFENRSRSGGGQVQQVVTSGTHAFVTFVDPQGMLKRLKFRSQQSHVTRTQQHYHIHM